MSLMTRLEALRAARARKDTSAATACDVQAVEMAEAANSLLSPQQDSCGGNAGRGEIGLLDELKPKDANCREENAIAARIAELHDRLGGFIKPFATEAA
jgi:hypothetical protein